MRVVTVSVNGLREAVRNGLFEWLEGRDADVVAIQDHRLSVREIEDEPELTPEGFQAWFIDGERAEDGGVGLFTRNFPKAIIYGFQYGPADREGRFLQADFEKVSVASVLAPRGEANHRDQEHKDAFMRAFLNHCGKTARKRRQFIVCANLQTAHRDSDAENRFHRQPVSGFLPHERAWLDELFNVQGFADAYREANGDGRAYTWWPEWARTWRKASGWRTDYQMATPGIRDRILGGYIDPNAGFSDHAPVVIDYDISPE